MCGCVLFCFSKRKSHSFTNLLHPCPSWLTPRLQVLAVSVQSLNDLCPSTHFIFCRNSIHPIVTHWNPPCPPVPSHFYFTPEESLQKKEIVTAGWGGGWKINFYTIKLHFFLVRQTQKFLKKKKKMCYMCNLFYVSFSNTWNVATKSNVTFLMIQ